MSTVVFCFVPCTTERTAAESQTQSFLIVENHDCPTLHKLTDCRDSACPHRGIHCWLKHFFEGVNK